MQSMMQLANSSVMSPFSPGLSSTCDAQPQKHCPKLFQHKKDCPIGLQLFGRIGKSVICLLHTIRITDRPMKLLYLLRYVYIGSLIFGKAGVFPLLGWFCGRSGCSWYGNGHCPLCWQFTWWLCRTTLLLLRPACTLGGHPLLWEHCSLDWDCILYRVHDAFQIGS